MSSNRCERNDCERKGILTPVLVIYDGPAHRRWVEFIIAVRACREHAIERTVDDLMTADGWSNLVTRIQDDVPYPLDKGHTVVEWRAREGNQVKVNGQWVKVAGPRELAVRGS